MELQILGWQGGAMDDSDVREHEARLRLARGREFDLVTSKLRRPLVRHGVVRRSLLIEQLAQGGGRPVRQGQTHPNP